MSREGRQAGGEAGRAAARPGPGGLGGLAGTTAQQRWAEGGCLKDQVKGKSEAAGTGGVRKRNREQTMKMMGRPDRSR